ncbi:glycoside hydrolase family 68 protein [Jiangella aurantiaca]|uniref:Glycoside hydrolase family 68 protein n=1 Tax=Jiangella aurantiaca TaxID=2530373 RepID=A0A4R5AM82_9ACTN|nr:glycoside hydrolase family 68 protein [Jiangella aurantiaca]TDD73075.1 glycoside hydrolase family 68 protein [Jiangella aurantiaca]
MHRRRGDRPARWTADHLDRIAQTSDTTAPLIVSPPPRVLPGHDVWDMWPVQEHDGSTAVVDGAELWMALAAPAYGHPEERHDRARLRLLTHADGRWTDRGDVFEPGTSLGSREWSGSAVRRPDDTVSTFYTAAGLPGTARPTFHQRVVEARSRLADTADGIRVGANAEHREIVRAEGPHYLPADEVDGGPGRIRAFRDPYRFRDPADGREHLLVAACVPWGDRFTGAIALASATAGGWALGPPVMVADGINHEIERPHIVVHRSRYYLFVCTSRRAFHPAGGAPTGLYGFVAPAVDGPYEPLNGTGLVIQNPPEQPDQAYAWLVLPTLDVHSFVDYLAPDGDDPRSAAAGEARSRFGGTFAPVLGLVVDGASTALRHAPSPNATRPTEGRPVVAGRHRPGPL